MTTNMVIGAYIGTYEAWRRFHADRGFDWDPRNPIRYGWLLFQQACDPASRVRGLVVSTNLELVDEGFGFPTDLRKDIYVALERAKVA